ncbi:CoB--CoM heterodisulfide reductase iron-sulfur subunit B family protein [Phorcysia thermohydrogeniphila]|uniref:Succinate dehydrogenase / fumarate reductase cytochrome b subunit n=1 Tax=Phorcysia thermohydrogeniphila TaxID=936138 RepID=A0A4R1GEP5_9BACT|nr:CoB--CoM heterodisulfide reductase iron-sulfur subunit B family protein [Phorcysia thermohydrogeniphila]TCK06704.1 succinate dehydrogenase / fumarate reductase cytochrome b subunit [Phorcysia thermohydrogeniphila]
MGKYAFYPGCAAKGASKELYEATVAVAKKLGIDMVELPQFSCCGAGVLEEVKDVLDIAVNARNLAYAEKEGRDIVTVCSTCLLVLRSAKYHLDNDDDLREQVNEILAEADLEYKGTVDVKHFHWVLLEEFGEEGLKEKVKKPLGGLKVYPFYGCHTVRPKDIIGYEPSENPQSLEKIIRALGATPVSGVRRLECCGFHAFWPAPQISMRLTGLNLKDAKESGADCVVTPCPLCHMNLDANQGRALKAIGENFQIPVLHVPQLVGLALGIEPKELGLHRNFVSFNFV